MSVITIAETPVEITLGPIEVTVAISSTEPVVAITNDGPEITVATTETTLTIGEMVVGTVIGSAEVQIVTVAEQGPQGIPGSSGTVEVDESLISLEWGTPSAETANAIEITGSIKTLAGAALASSVVDVQVIVSDGATDCEPSATATLSAAGTPVGTVLAGSGTATLTIRSNAESLSIRASETAAAHRYLWLRNGGHQRLWVRSLTGVQELIFA